MYSQCIVVGDYCAPAVVHYIDLQLIYDTLCYNEHNAFYTIQANSPKRIKLTIEEREGEGLSKLLSAGWSIVEGRDAIKKGDNLWSVCNGPLHS